MQLPRPVTARRGRYAPQARYRRRAGALVVSAVAAASWLTSGRNGEGSIAALGLGAVRPNHTKVTLGPFDVDALIQDKSRWQVAIAESGQDPSAIISNLDGGNVTKFSVDFDSERSGVKLPPFVQRLGFTAHGNDADLGAADWTLDVLGENGRHISATEEDGQVVYDASVGFEFLAPAGVTVRYAADAKRQATVNGSRFDLTPSSLKQGLGLKTSTDVGDFKLSAYQSDAPGAAALEDLEFGAQYHVEAASQPGSPETTMAARIKHGEPEFIGVLGVTGPNGTTGGLDVGYKQGVFAVRGRGGITYQQEVAPGLSVGAATGLAVTPIATGPRGMPAGGLSAAIGNRAELTPVQLAASADLAKIMPEYAGEGSHAMVQASYSPGDSRPSNIGATVRVSTAEKAPVAAEMVAAAAVDESGQPAFGLSANAEAGNVKMMYSGKSQGPEQFAEVSYTPPVEVQKAALKLASTALQLPVTPDLKEGVKASVFGRAIQRDGAKPRLQLGFAYGVDGKVKMSGEDVLYDSGGEMLTPGGGVLQDAHAAIVERKKELAARIQGSYDGLGKLWIQN